MTAAFRFGLHFWQLPLGDWRSRVRRYEALGFSSITFTDYLVVPQWEPIGWSVRASLADSTMERMVEKAGWVPAGAAATGRDPAAIELNAMVFGLAVGDDASARREALARDNGVAASDLRDSSLFLSGTGSEVRNRLIAYRDRVGLTYFSLFDPGRSRSSISPST